MRSLRDNTESELEIIIVDNGSAQPVRKAVQSLADSCILNEENRGFASGMNQGLELVGEPVVVFANNDTVFPPGWDTKLLDSLGTWPNAGLVVPAVTASGNPRTVRSEPGTAVERLPPFSEPPSGIVYMMKTDLIREMGGWSTDYKIASGEDWDLCFSLWVNGFEIYYDTRVLVQHVSKGTAAEKLGDWRPLWRENRNRFLDKWSSSARPAPQIGDPAVYEVRAQQLRVVVGWMRQFYTTRDELRRVRQELQELRKEVGGLRRGVERLENQNRTLNKRATLAYQLRILPARARRKARHLLASIGGGSRQEGE